MDETLVTPCPQCRRLEQKLQGLLTKVEALESLVLEQQRELEALQARNVHLEAQLAAAKKNSSNSSKPPCSDIVKPPPTPPADGTTDAKRSAGGQPGHPRHERTLFPPELLTGGRHDHRLDCCPTCGHDLLASEAAPRIVQQLDIKEIPIVIEEHRGVPGWCPQCQKLHYGSLPSVIAKGGLVGPRLTTIIAFLKGGCHASFSTIRKFVRDVLQVTISRSQLSKIIAKVTEALEAPYEELLKRVPLEGALNVDETGHKDKGDRWWTWCFRASLYTLFKIDPTRSGDVLHEVLGEDFHGVLGCDFYSAYRRYMRECSVVVQFCLAHLIREIKFLQTLPSAEERAYGERLCSAIRQLFGVIHAKDKLSPEEFAQRLAAARKRVLYEGSHQVPSGKHSRNLAARFEKHGDSYFQFITTPGVEPTNNVVEQAIRFVVIDRLITQGTRSEGGRKWCERIWTVMATCCQQGRSVFEYLNQAVLAHFQGTAVPSLIGSQD